MAGSPLKRARREQTTLSAIGHDGQPLKPLVKCSALPSQWTVWSDTERIRHLFGMSLERAHDYLSLAPVETLDPHLQASQREAMRLMIVTTREIAMAAQRTEERRRVIDQIAVAVRDTSARAAVDLAAHVETAETIAAPQQSDVPDAAERRKNGDKTD